MPVDHPQTNDTDIRIVNAALAALGAGEITSFSDETDLTAKVNAVYVDLVESCLAAHSWSFTRTQRQLELEAAAPAPGYRYRYALPPDRIGLPMRLTRAGSREPLREYMIAGSSVHANTNPLWAAFRFRPAVALWPAPFRRFVTKALAAELAVPVSHDANMAARLDEEAWGPPREGRRSGLFGKAMAQDLAQPGPEPLPGRDALTDAWHGNM